MKKPPLKLRIDLRVLILALSVVSGLTGLFNVLYASYKVEKELLIERTLETHRVYTAKLAQSTGVFFYALQKTLSYSAAGLSDQLDNDVFLQREVDRLRLQSDSFNAVYLVDNQGKILNESPQSMGIKGLILNTDGAKAALKTQRPLISNPYISASGNRIVFISHPIFSEQGQYLGYIGGNIYLQQKNILHSMLGEHFYQDGSYLYVVDKDKKLIYHPDTERIGEIIDNNQVIEMVVKGQSGAQQLINSKGEKMVAGYAFEPTTGWGIVAQRPTAVVLAKLNDLVIQIVYNAVPLGIVTLLMVWWLAKLISKPLWQLAKSTENMEQASASENIRKISSWYFEVAQLKRAILLGVELLQQRIGKLRHEILLDPMTGLYNRRGLDAVLADWGDKNRAFAVISLDIDYFKQVNDTFGHDTGDKVIKALAKLLQDNSREDDIVCRTGGEEFMILLPDMDSAKAGIIAERIRHCLEQMDIPPVKKHITVSLGVAQWPDDGADIHRVLKQSDEALYQAKHSGRNCVVLFRQQEAIE